MNDQEMIYTAAQHEREMTRLEVQCKRWFTAFLVVLCMLFATNIAWVIYECSFTDIIIDQNADSGDGGTAQVFGAGMGDVNYGQSETDD